MAKHVPCLASSNACGENSQDPGAGGACAVGGTRAGTEGEDDVVEEELASPLVSDLVVGGTRLIC